MDLPTDKLRDIRAVSDAALSYPGPEDFLTELLSRVKVSMDADTASALLLDRSARQLARPLLVKGMVIGVLHVGSIGSRVFTGAGATISKGAGSHVSMVSHPRRRPGPSSPLSPRLTTSQT